MSKKVAFYTLGCKVNQYETNAMAQKFIEKGYKVVEFETQADIYIINTCTVTSIADKKSRQIIRQAKQKNSKALVIATGCYAQVGKEELEKIEELDSIVGNAEKTNIVEIIENLNNKSTIKVGKIEEEKEFQDFGTVTYTEKTRAVIKVQDGCKLESVVEEVKEIVSKGIKEVVITGIHVASYGKDFENGKSLIDLLEEINKIEGLKRIRLRFTRTNFNNRGVYKKIK